MIDFGSIAVATSSPVATVQVTNVGGTHSGQVSPLVTGPDAMDFKVVDGCDELLPLGTCTVTVTFSPTSVGMKSASLSVSSSPGGLVMVALGGTATN